MRKKCKTVRNKMLGIACSVFLLVGLSGCQSNPSDAVTDPKQQSYQYTDFVMDTVLSETIYGKTDDCTKELQDTLKNLEETELSWRIDTSEIAMMNRSLSQKQSCEMTDKMTDWINATLQLAMDSEGAFDPTIGELTRLWNIEGENPKVPAQKEIDTCLSEVGYDALKCDANTINIEETRSIDLGAAGKGIACDVAYEYLSEKKDIDGAVIAVGGSILTYDDKPDGSSWGIAIQDPEAEDGTPMGVLNLKGTNYISTSGDYEKYFIQDGKKYHHILDPKTGYPSESGLSSVTIISDNGLLSDGLSTACFILGKEKSASLLEKYHASAVFIDQNRQVTLIGDKAKEAFELINENYVLK